MNLEILKCSTNVYEVIDYSGDRLFEGTLLECEDYVADFAMDDAEDSEFD